MMRGKELMRSISSGKMVGWVMDGPESDIPGHGGSAILDA